MGQMVKHGVVPAVLVPETLKRQKKVYHSDKGGKDVATNPSAEYFPL